VAIRLANSVDDYRIYHHIYRDAVDRWGEDVSYGFTIDQFEQIYQLSLIYPEHIKLWLMVLDDQIVGGTIVLYWGKHALAWNGTAHRDFLDYDVMPVGDTEMIRDAIARGYSYFDFSTCHDNQGLIEYKRRFGSTAIPLRGWLYEHPLLRSTRAAYQWLRRNRSSIISSVAVSRVAIDALQMM
jgi:CelD/BcsL family acetyltransferase involved in cellulose biosynthesis